MKKLSCIGCGTLLTVPEKTEYVKCATCSMRLADALENSAREIDIEPCPHHPQYNGVGPTRSGCKTCEEIFRIRRGEGLL
jgi:LSD1 subclass zinc finger protein